MRTVALFAVLGSLLAASILVAFYLWTELGDAEMSWHGYLALALGAGLTAALGVGLMGLAFYSNRRGHDDYAYEATEDRGSTPLPPADA